MQMKKDRMEDAMEQEKLEALDARIERIWKKMENLPEELDFSCGEWPPRWEAPFAEAQVAQWEEKYKVRLPEDYRRFITTKASGGTQPFYGLCSLKSKEMKEMLNNEDFDLSRPFPCTVDKPLLIFAMTDEEQEAYFSEDEDEEEMEKGYIPLCTEGCGMDSILVVSAQDEATYGTVWFYDFANDFGMAPIRNQETGEPFCFLDWLEYWVDFTVSHKPSEYFSYGELTGPFAGEDGE